MRIYFPGPRDTAYLQFMKNVNNGFDHEEWSKCFCGKPVRFGDFFVTATALPKI